MGIPEKKSFSEILKRERNQRGWSQQRLAEVLGTQREVVARWEGNKAFPAPYFREQLIKVFGKNAEELGLISKQSGELSEASQPLPEPTSQDRPQDLGSSSEDEKQSGLDILVALRPAKTAAEAVSSPEELQPKPIPEVPNPPLLATKGRIAIAVAVVLVVAALFMVVVIKLSIPQLKAHYKGTATCDRGCDRSQMGKPLNVELFVNHQDWQGNVTAKWVYTDRGGHTYSCRGNVTRDNTLTLICTGGVPGWTLTLSGQIYPDGHLEGGLDGTNGSSSLHKTWTTHTGF